MNIKIHLDNFSVMLSTNTLSVGSDWKLLIHCLSKTTELN